MITSAAMKNGFTGGLIVDFPTSKKAKKYFLFLMAGYSEEIIKEAEEAVYLPKAVTEGEDYDYSSSDEDSDMEQDDNEEEKEEQKESESSEDEDEMQGRFKPKENQIKQVGKRRVSKTIQKAKSEKGRWKPNGNRKNKKWIMMKKDR